LSFYLQLKAEDKRTDHLIILFDEPGMYLHSKAQLDMIKVFEELSSKNQIIYSTHSPYLIDTAKLHRLRLVLNTKETGTTTEKITSNKINNQKDALKPIIDALGLEVASPFSVAKKNNVILEGISDFHYMQSMKLLLGKNIEIGLLPSMGSSNSHLLMEICMGWGLNWIIVFDDKGAVKEYNKIKKQFFNDNEEETQKRIFRLKDCDGIEDMFTVGDMKLVDPQSQFSADKKNSEVVSQHGGKELYARLFYEKALKGDITKEKISVTALKNFEKVFSFIDTAFEIES
jgi:predicted ATP-dependent endonuclease of OLD family